MIEAEGYRFNFQDAIDVLKFDERNPSSSTFHDAPMKAVDLIVEFEREYLFVEVKEYPSSYSPEMRIQNTECDQVDCPYRINHFTWLKNYLKYKYRDTYLFRYAEGKIDKPVYYLCLLNFDDAQNSVMQQQLYRELPVGLASKRWVKELVKKCQVLNLSAWNRNFPKWPVEKL